MNKNSPYMACFFHECDRKSASHYLFVALRPRFILSTKYDNRALSFFLPRHKRHIFKSISLVHRIRKARIFLCETPMFAFLRKKLDCKADWVTSISLGTKGPYNKKTILFEDRFGEPRLIAKLGTTLPAVTLLKNEAHWLSVLLDKVDLKEMVPALVSFFYFGELFVVAEHAQRGACSNGRLGEGHLRFLSALQSSFAVHDGYCGSKMENVMLQRFKKIQSALSDEWRLRIEKAIILVQKGFKNYLLPMCAAHRDFVPWNILIKHDGIFFVYDWEYAAEECVPLYDVFHFLCKPRLLSRGPSRRFATKILTKAEFFCRQLPKGNMKILAVDIQFLAYLLDWCIFSLEANGGLDGEDVILKRYGWLIDTFIDWKK